MFTSRGAAAIGFLLAIVSAIMPWWQIRLWEDGALVANNVFFPFRPFDPVTTTWGPWLTGGLVAAAALLLMVRLAGQSWYHEPKAWRRDLLVAAGILLAAMISMTTWPESVAYFWGGQEVVADDGRVLREQARPGIGWWTAGLAAAAMVWARFRPLPELDGSAATET